MRKRDKLRMLQTMARQWLITFDLLGAYWAGLPASSDFLAAVYDNELKFGEPGLQGSASANMLLWVAGHAGWTYKAVR